ncbi:MAG: anaerobic glycerol-3-phosphate dehydrogenase subunit GlpC [Thermodesulfobacteriota bacterium]
MENISFDHCLKCTVCTVYCPVARVTPLFPGPKQMGPDTERLRIKNPELVDESLKYCTNCKRCEIACPSDVKIADLIQEARCKYLSGSFRPRDYLLSRTDLLGRFSTSLTPLVNTLSRNRLVTSWLEKFMKIPAKRPLPLYGRGTFGRWFRRHAAGQRNFPARVVYFRGCYVNYNDHDLGRDVIKVLNALGVGVSLVREVCCGVPLIASGYLDRARLNARRNILALGQAVGPEGMTIVSASSTCTLALRHEYSNLLQLDVSPIAGRVEYITRFIGRKLEAGPPLRLEPLNLTAAYHPPCHLERLGGAIDTIEVLRRLPGLKLKLINTECCGLAGTYGFKSEFFRLSQAVGADTFKRIAAAEPDLVVTDCETCKWQIEMNTPYRVVHPVSLLARALPA